MPTPPMTFIRKKKLKGKERTYAEQSFRLPDGRVKKASVYLSAHRIAPKDINKRLNDKKISTFQDWAASFYKKNSIFSEDTLKSCEYMAHEYRRLMHKLTEQQRKDVLDRFTINFTYESNAIEGNSLTLKDVTFIIKEGKVLAGKDIREVYETVNTRKAIEMIFNKTPSITEKDIIYLHQLIVENTGVSPGYKKFPNYLLGRSIKTTPPEKVADEMQKLINDYENQENLHPLQRAALFHGRFEQIHPFEDGNGRVGRLLTAIILLKQGYPPLIIRKSHRLAYFSALEAFDNKHPGKLYWFMIEKYKKTFENFFHEYVKYL